MSKNTRNRKYKATTLPKRLQTINHPHQSIIIKSLNLYIMLIFKSSNFKVLANLTNTFTNFQHDFAFFRSNNRSKFNESTLS
jgi:hypothetical protein